MTRQEIFNIAYRGLKSQGFKGSEVRGLDPLVPQNITCAYRGDGGRKCAIGFLIPDERYSPNIEGKGVIELVDNVYPDLIPTDGEEAFLRRLQECHDTAFSVEAMEYNLKEFARKENLEVPED